VNIKNPATRYIHEGMPPSRIAGRFKDVRLPTFKGLDAT